MDWETYEEITKDVYEILGKQSGVKILGHGKKFKYRGKSNVEHQIDVLTSHSDGIHNYLTDIECKYWNQNIDKDIIMKVDSIVKDCNFNKGVIVSKLGFTPDAEQYAKYIGVGLVILREPIEEDWEGRVKTIVFEINSCTPHITKYENKAIEVFKDISGMIKTDRYYYILDNNIKKTMKEYLDEFQKELFDDYVIEEITKEIIFEKPVSMVDIDGNIISKNIGIKMSGKLEVLKSVNEIHAEDNVWLFMKSIFEQKTYAISKNKEIRDVSE